jgi:hypothetical protein
MLSNLKIKKIPKLYEPKDGMRLSEKQLQTRQKYHEK